MKKTILLAVIAFVILSCPIYASLTVTQINGNVNVTKTVTDDPSTQWGEYSYQYRFLSGGSGEFSMQVYIDTNNNGVFDSSEALTGAVQPYVKWFDGATQSDKFINQIGSWSVIRNDSQRLVVTAQGNDTVQKLTYDVNIEFFNETDVARYSVRVRYYQNPTSGTYVRNLYSNVFAFSTTTMDYLYNWNLTDYKTFDMRNNLSSASVVSDTTTSSGSGLGLTAQYNKYHGFLCTADGKSFGALSWNQKWDAYQEFNTNWNGTPIYPTQIERLNGTNLMGTGVNFPQEFYGFSSFRGNSSRDTIGLSTATNNNIKINSSNTNPYQIGVLTGFFYVFNYTNGCGASFTAQNDPVSRDAQQMIAFNANHSPVTWYGNTFRKLFDTTAQIAGIGVDPLWMNAYAAAQEFNISVLKTEFISQASDLVRFQIPQGNSTYPNVWWETTTKNYTAQGAFWQNYRTNFSNPANPEIESWYLGQGATGFLLTLYDVLNDTSYIDSAAEIRHYWNDAHWNDVEGNFYWHGGAEVGTPASNFSRWSEGAQYHRLNTHLFAVHGMIGTALRLPEGDSRRDELLELADSGIDVIFRSNSTWYLDNWINESTGRLIEEYKNGANYTIVDSGDNYYGVEMSIFGKLPEYDEDVRNYIITSSDFNKWMIYAANTTLQTSGLTAAQQRDRDMQISRGLAMISRYKPEAVTWIPRNTLKNQSSTKPLTYTFYLADKVGIRGYSYYNPTPDVYIYDVDGMLNWSTLVSDTSGVLEFALVSFDETINNEVVRYHVPSTWKDVWQSTNNQWMSRNADGTYEFNLTKNESYIVAIGNFSFNFTPLSSFNGTSYLYSNENGKVIDYNINSSQKLNETVGILQVWNDYDSTVLGNRDVSAINISRNSKRVTSSLSNTINATTTILFPSQPSKVRQISPSGATNDYSIFTYNTGTQELTFALEGIESGNTSIYSVPEVNTSRVLQNGAATIYSNASIIGYCNATDVIGTTLTYNYIWYRNGTQHTSGTNNTNVLQGMEVPVATINDVVVGETYIFSCQANNSYTTSAYLNSTQVNVTNVAPSVERIFPDSPNSTLGENATHDFEIEASDDDGGNLIVEWFKNGVSQLLEIIANGASSVWSWVVGYQDSGEYNITVNVTDQYNETTTLEWNITIEDTYPIPEDPLAVDPVSGQFEYNIPLHCRIDYEPVRPYYFNWIYNVNGSSYYDMNINNTNGYIVFDISADSYGTNYTFGCKVLSPSGESNYTYSNMFSKINKNNFYLFELPGQTTYQAMIPYNIGYVMEAENGIGATIAAGFVDCNGNGLWDYTFDYREESVTTARETFACINAAGTVETTIGMILYKNNTASWESLNCKGVSTDKNYCAVYKTYEVTVR